MSLGGFNSFRTLSLVFLVAAEGPEAPLCTWDSGMGLVPLIEVHRQGGQGMCHHIPPAGKGL